MNTVFEMAFITITIIVFFFETLVATSRYFIGLITRFRDEKRETILQKKDELKDLQSQQQGISAQDEFAKYARLQRKVNKLKNEISSIVKERNMKVTKLHYTIKSCIYLGYVLSSFIILLLHRSVICISIPEQWLYPFGPIVSFPLFTSGVISVPVWMGICRSVSKMVLT